MRNLVFMIALIVPIMCSPAPAQATDCGAESCASVSLDGRQYMTSYYRMTDNDGTPIDTYYYPVFDAAGSPIYANGAYLWNRFVRVPAAGYGQPQAPVVWYHVIWSQQNGAWVSTGYTVGNVSVASLPANAPLAQSGQQNQPQQGPGAANNARAMQQILQQAFRMLMPSTAEELPPLEPPAQPVAPPPAPTPAPAPRSPAPPASTYQECTGTILGQGDCYGPRPP